MKKGLIIGLLLSSMFLLVGCGGDVKSAEQIQQEQEQANKEILDKVKEADEKRQELTEEQSAINLLETVTKGKAKEVEKGFIVVTTNLEDKSNVENIADIDGDIELSVKSILKHYNKVQYIYKRDNKSVAILDYIKEDLDKISNAEDIIEVSSNKFIDPTFK